MSEAALKIISDAMEELELNYEFGKWSSDIVYPYFVGEYQEDEPVNEDGFQETVFMITGFTRSSWLDLEEAKNKVSNYFHKVSGKTVIAENGSAVAVFYSTALIVPTEDAELKKIQINLTVKEWSVN